MPNFQTIVLDTATPQLRAPGTGDGYSFNSGATNLGVWTTTGLGIGTSSPSNGAKLDAAGAIISTAATLSSFNANNAGFDFIAASKIGRFFATSTDTTGGTMTFTTGQNGTYQTSMTILNSGNVGIGTSSPTTRLEVNNGINNTDGTVTLRAVCGTAGVDPAGFFGTTGAHPLILRTNATERLRIDSAGNMGLGVTPSAWGTSTRRAIQINSGSIDSGSATGSNVAIRSNEYFNGTNNVYINTQAAAAYIQNNGQHAFYTAPSGTAGTNVSYTQAMTLNASGELLLGTTSAFNSTAGRANVSINGSSTAMYNLGVANASVGYLYHTGTDMWLNNVQNGILSFYTNNTERARIPAAGGFVVGTAALATTATDGFLYIPGCAGTPTGTPTAYTGRVPLVVDTTNNKLYFYSSGVWRDAGP